MYRNLRWAGLILASTLVISYCAGKNSPSSPTPAAACSSFSLSTRTLSVGAAGGSSAITVTTDAACAWTAVSDHTWMRIASGASGTGSGTVTVDLTANAGEAARTAILTIGGQTISVQQAGTTPCSFTIAPASATFTKDAGTGGFDLATGDACTWTAASSASWVTITSAAQGTGGTRVTYAVARNTDTMNRTASIAIADRVFSIAQSGDSGVCTYSVGPVSLSACMSSPSSISTTITTAPACPWTVGTNASWLTPGGTSGSGSSTITLTLTPNWDAPRTGIVMVRWPTPTAGQNVVVSQAGCRYAVSPSSLAIAVAGGTSQFDVLQESDPMECGGPLQNACMWTAVSTVPWITVTTSMPEYGDDPVHFTVAPNTTGLARTGTITVRDQTVTITQAGV